MPEPTDEELMSAVAEGNARAFALLVERHRGGAMRLAYNVVRDAAEAEDIVQDAFERVWTKARSWTPRGGSRFFAWLARVTVNLSIDRKRRLRPEPLADGQDVASGELGAEDRLAGRQIGRRIAAALERLPERQRIAFALCQIERLSNAAAAASLGISIGALELLLVRARKAMRRQLADLLEEKP